MTRNGRLIGSMQRPAAFLFAAGVVVTTFVMGGCVRARAVEAPGPGHPAYTDDTERYEMPRNMLADEASPPRVVPSDGAASDTAHEHHGSHGVAVYQCPMHPEVRSDRPGACPKCGMALVKINDTHDHGGGR